MKQILTIAVLMFAMLPILASAEMEYDFGVVGNVYDDRADDSLALQFKVSNTNFPIYAWAGFEETTLKLGGYDIVDDHSFASVGVGFEQNWKQFSLFIEAGYGFISDDWVDDPDTVDGIYAELEHDHGTSPSERPNDTNDIHTDYSIDDEFIGRVGIGYQPFKNLKFTASYRHFKPTEFYNFWTNDPSHAVGTIYEGRRGWWQEKNNVDLNAYELGIFFTF